MAKTHNDKVQSKLCAIHNLLLRQIDVMESFRDNMSGGSGLPEAPILTFPERVEQWMLEIRNAGYSRRGNGFIHLGAEYDLFYMRVNSCFWVKDKNYKDTCRTPVVDIYALLTKILDPEELDWGLSEDI